jgi:hypothetical protein
MERKLRKKRLFLGWLWKLKSLAKIKIFQCNVGFSLLQISRFLPPLLTPQPN